jgi:hypothetical protein
MNKKLLYGLMAAFLSVTGFKAQRHEIGLRAGMSNLVRYWANQLYIARANEP